MKTTTLNEILSHDPCVDGWVKLTGQSELRSEWVGNDDPLTLKNIYDSNGFKDTLWACRVLKGDDLKEFKHLICDFAERSLKYVADGDDRPRLALETARKYINGEVTLEELLEAAAAAAAAADAASYAAADAAYTAASYAAANAANAANAAAYAAYAAAASTEKEREVQSGMLAEFISK